MTRRQKVKRTVVAVAMFAAAWLLSGCDDRTCLRGHVENTVMPVTVVGANGQVSTTVVPSTTFVCDEYAPTSHGD